MLLLFLLCSHVRSLGSSRSSPLGAKAIAGIRNTGVSSMPKNLLVQGLGSRWTHEEDGFDRRLGPGVRAFASKMGSVGELRKDQAAILFQTNRSLLDLVLP